MRLKSSYDVVVKDVGAGPVSGCHQKSQTNQLFEIPSKSAMARATDFAHVVGALVLVADALLLGVPIVPARARIHRRHEHKRRGILCRIFCPTNTDYPILQRLAHHLQHSTFYEEWRDYFNSAALATEEELRRVMDDEPEKS